MPPSTRPGQGHVVQEEAVPRRERLDALPVDAAQKSLDLLPIERVKPLYGNGFPALTVLLVADGGRGIMGVRRLDAAARA